MLAPECLLPKQIVRRLNLVIHKCINKHLSMLCSGSRIATSSRSSGWSIIVVPRQIGMIAQLSGLDEVGGGKEHSKDDADSSDDEICNPKE